ncbi:hypothetical protein AN958_07118 [Leucoagaricus sp. SymC.cos]|nr:hypothetical protein AN958_07118 [Leucoagaricus sp. SymC.cos]
MNLLRGCHQRSHLHYDWSRGKSRDATFINSAKNFISSHKITGIEIDFECYIWQAPPSDAPNLTSFHNDLRSGLCSSHISLATLAGHWSLEG